ncbi:hypothetical protein RSOLAG1IB_12576 [Rhizoctonia solani AG-1 IB]|uniref:ATP-dependent DNA helicase n=1 Tax=Thanatephorus cucumeris (strain AG1-IB / isolate 7/3/14) TaxID=1108050 RepID=A0A0B7G2X6_THACB|nr:hypothetical protein RSOLAG1IB_12576 [Rhizoctonia solani AG-1 IB]
MHKYVHKGEDRVAYDLENPNEVQEHREGRYVSASQAAWRIAGNNMAESCPNVVRLQFHLEDEENIVFQDDTPIAQVLANRKDTMLLAFFKLNEHPVIGTRMLANSLVYQEIPGKFTWDQKNRRWKPRVRLTGSGIGRMPFIPATCGEKYYLRLLLTIVKGCTSFASLRTFEGQVYNTYRECCIARGLLEDDGEWHSCLQEAGVIKTGVQLRKLFVIILTMGQPTSPMRLWNTHKSNICSDLQYRLRQRLGPDQVITEEDTYDYGLYLVQQLIEESGTTMEDCGIEVCQKEWAIIIGDGNRFIQEQLHLGREQVPGIAEEYRTMLNQEQAQAYEEIYQSTIAPHGKVFFLDGPAGTGKTFLYKTLCYQLRSEGKIVLCVASSGIAALLLPGGRTSHSRLKIPIKVNDNSTCSINKNSDLGQMIKQAKLIIWDEVPMQNKLCAHAFDKTARDLFDNPNIPFGGVTIVFGGDFRQVLPVVRNGDRQQIIAASLRRSYVWHHLQKLRLQVNMRIQNDPEAAHFAQFLLDIGAGTTIPQGSDSGPIEFPAHITEHTGQYSQC